MQNNVASLVAWPGKGCKWGTCRAGSWMWTAIMFLIDLHMLMFTESCELGFRGFIFFTVTGQRVEASAKESSHQDIDSFLF